jgi:glutamate formiminotransferase
MDVVESIAHAAEGAFCARVIDCSSDPDHNRMVLTLLGALDEIRASVLASASRAVELIDMREHAGAHPRVGAADVVPIVPVRDISMAECIALSRLVGHDIADKLGVPVYFYEQSATASRRVSLPDIRRGGYERLAAEGDLEGDLSPDLGPHRVHPTAGATVIGARTPLIAYNINLATPDMRIAREIVRKLRSGEGGLTGVRSISVWLAARSLAQVSMNITRPDLVSMQDVYRFVESEVRRRGVEIAESEIIGAIRLHDLQGTSPSELRAIRFRESQIIDNWLD